MPTPKDNARCQAVSQVESIVEMVAKLKPETAAKLFVSELTPEKQAELLREAFPDEDPAEKTAEDLVEAIAEGDFLPTGYEFDEEAAQEAITEDPLCLEVRSGWVAPGHLLEPEEAVLLLCTGGPAVRVLCDVRGGELENPRVEFQDWYTPWQHLPLTESQCEAVETYIAHFSINI